MVALWRPYQREEWVSQDNYGGTFSLALPLKTCFYNVSRIFLGGGVGHYFPIWNACDLNGLDSGSSRRTSNHIGLGKGFRVEHLTQ